jgi:GT2 family glycosyltransferase
MKNGAASTNNDSYSPVCSVCIANYNGIKVLYDCVHSVLSQDCDFPVEIIIHDDASTDQSVEFIKNNFHDVILIASRGNVGFCVSNNRMVARAKGQYILLLNNDAMLYPDALRIFYEHAKAQKEHAVLGLRQYDASTGELRDFGIFFDPFLNSIPNLNLRLTSVGMVLGACLWIPKALWDKIGGFPEWFHTMHEDMYICCRTRLYGYPVKAIPESGYKHWVGQSLGGGKVVAKRLSTPLRRRALSERNRLYVISLCYPNPLFYIILPLHIVLLLLEGVLLASMKKNVSILDLVYLGAIKDLWRRRKDLFHQRRKIQSQNVLSIKDFFSVFNLIPHKLHMLVKHGIPEIT